MSFEKTQPVMNKKKPVKDPFVIFNHEKAENDDVDRKDVFYKLNTLYAITINPDDKHQCFSFPYVQRMQECRKHMYDILQTSVKGFHYELYMEISEPTHQYNDSGYPRVHYHGTIRFDTKESLRWWLLDKVRSFAHWTQTKVKNITDKDGWFDYCTKQYWLNEMKPLSNSHHSLLNGKSHSDLHPLLSCNSPVGELARPHSEVTASL